MINNQLEQSKAEILKELQVLQSTKGELGEHLDKAQQKEMVNPYLRSYLIVQRN